MSQLLVCMMYLPALAVSGSLIASCPQDEEHFAGIVMSLKIVKSPGACLVVRLVCGPRSLATLAAVVCRPTGAFGSPARNFIACARAARCAAVGTNGRLLVAARTSRPAATCPVLATALPVAAGLPGAAEKNRPANSAGTDTNAMNAYHRLAAHFLITVMRFPPCSMADRATAPTATLQAPG